MVLVNKAGFSFGWRLELQGNGCCNIKTLQFEVGMKPKPRPDTSQLDLFQAQFKQLLNPDHPLVLLANRIDWQRFCTPTNATNVRRWRVCLSNDR